MIPRYNGAQAQKMISNTSLPAGGYVAKIVGARVELYGWGQVLVVAFDVAEGEYAGHFKKIFDETNSPDKKWKGTFRLTIPDEKSQYFSSQKRTFNNFIFAVEESNKGFRFDWDESHLGGKLFGALVRNKEFLSSKGEKITTTECGGCTDVQSIRDGNFTLPKDKLLGQSEHPAQTQSNNLVDLSDDDLPF